MERQITQAKWNLRQMFDQRINQLERIQLTQRPHPESRGMQNPPSPIRKQQNRKKMLVLQKIWNQGQTNVIDSRENNIMKQKKELKFYLKSIAYRMKNSIKRFLPYLELQRLHSHRDNLRDGKQDFISKQQQEDKINDLQDLKIRKNQMNMTSNISDKKKLLKTLILLLTKKR